MSLIFYKVKYILIVGCIKCLMLKGKESKKNRYINKVVLISIFGFVVL